MLNTVLILVMAAGTPASPGPVGAAAFAPEAHAVSVLVFVATECPIANASAPTLNRLAAEFADEEVAFFRVYSDPGVEADEIATHGRDFAYTFSGILDTSQALARHAGATRVPEAAVFDAEGELVYRGRIDNAYADFGKRRRHVTEHDLQDAIRAVLAGEPVAHPRTDALGCYITLLDPDQSAARRDEEIDHADNQAND